MSVSATRERTTQTQVVTESNYNLAQNYSTRKPNVLVPFPLLSNSQVLTIEQSIHPFAKPMRMPSPTTNNLPVPRLERLQIAETASKTCLNRFVKFVRDGRFPLSVRHS